MAASRGYEVTAFEAMQKNARILNVSLCANPDLERFVTLHNVGLSDKPGKCFIVSADTNLADGIMRCDLKRAEDFKQEGYKVRGEIKLETMDAMVKGDYFMMKIDIEGAEPLALSEAGSSKYFSQHKIQYMLTEAVDKEARVGYFGLLDKLGYQMRPVDYASTSHELDAMYRTQPLPKPTLRSGRATIAAASAVGVGAGHRVHGAEPFELLLHGAADDCDAGVLVHEADASVVRDGNGVAVPADAVAARRL